MTDEILRRAVQTHILSKEEIIRLLSMQNAQTLFVAADEVRRKFVGDGVYLRALIEFSNYCKNNCLYCGIRAGNSHVKRYRLTPQQIITTAKQAVSYGYKTIVLQSGEDLWFDTDKLCEIIREIKKLDVALTLSIGEKTREEYAAYRQAGADRYLLRIETTDKELYEKLDPQMRWENRVRCLHDLKALGYEVGSGSLVGLPGQTVESLADDLLFFQKLPVDMAGIGPFIPHQQTPLATEKADGHFDLALKMMAVMRLLLPDINIPATTAMETLHPQGRLLALQAGANVVMPNTTDTEFRPFYELYPGKICLGDSAEKCRGCVENKIKSIGRFVAHKKGFHGDYLKKV
ncbi:[FeFe] hydrogenase H-cluster radical SAM maturase HydE [Candidatus Avelusimicrobium luingense]|uniref:[FeFe] hydrogenase H-cluster radical SAM maturase HydE n=1 Tax=Candidatus Avelusimicrobium luingense TaxID=3416211 RepID=UPI003D15186A